MLLKLLNKYIVSFLLMHNYFLSPRDAVFIASTVCMLHWLELSCTFSGPCFRLFHACSNLIPWFFPQLWLYHLSLIQVWTMDSVPNTVLGTLPGETYLIFSTVIWNSYYQLHFTNKETEVQKIKWLAQDHTARMWFADNLNPGSISLEPVLFTILPHSPCEPREDQHYKAIEDGQGAAE